MRILPSLLLPALLAPAPHCQELWVVRDADDTIVKVSAVDGSLLDPAFVDLGLSGVASTPIEVVVVGEELWVSDQTADLVMRFSGDGSTFLGTVGGARDNLRGLAFAGGQVHVTNAGTANGAPGDVVKQYDTSGNLQGSFPTGDPFDVAEVAGQLLVANLTDDAIDAYDTGGNFLGRLVDSDGVTGIDFPEQINVRASGNLLVGGFADPAGIYEYDPQGNQVAYWPVGSGVRAAAELAGGLLLWTNSAGIHVFDPAAGTSNLVLSGSSRFITAPGEGSTIGTSYCTAAGNSVSPAGSRISALGSTSLGVGSVLLRADSAPSQPALFYFGPLQQIVPFGNGFRCVGGQVTRMPVVAGSGGQFSYSIDFAVYGPILGGLGTASFQCWYRDPAGGGAAFNLSDGLEIVFVP